MDVAPVSPSPVELARCCPVCRLNVQPNDGLWFCGPCRIWWSAAMVQDHLPAGSRPAEASPFTRQRRPRVSPYLGLGVAMLSFVLTGTGFVLNQLLFERVLPELIEVPVEHDRFVEYYFDPLA